MNWLSNFVKPKLSALVKRKKVPENLWNNCPVCGSMIHHKDLSENLRVCISCNHHFRMSAEDRIKTLFVDEEINEIKLDNIVDDPLNFNDKKKYKDRLKEYRKKTNRNDAFILIERTLGGLKIIIGFMNFEFMDGSMGRSVGSAIIKGARVAVEKKIPFIIALPTDLPIDPSINSKFIKPIIIFNPPSVLSINMNASLRLVFFLYSFSLSLYFFLSFFFRGSSTILSSFISFISSSTNRVFILSSADILK
jgi:DNA-directed RNA polymerase subunit M/transcription elongation factor TFIIS